MWKKVEGTGWLSLGEYGRINPRSWGSGIDRQVFTAEHPDGGFYLKEGEETTGSSEFEFDRPFVLLGGAEGPNLEIVISPLVRGQYGVRYRVLAEERVNIAWSGE